LLALPHHPAAAQAAPRITSMPAAPNPANLLWQKLALQHVTPSDLLKLMHWETEKTIQAAPRNMNLPSGVQAIYALQSDNALLVQATPEGFASVKEIVKTLDVEPRIIQVQWQMVDVPISEWKKLEGVGDTPKLLAALMQGNYKTITSPTITTSDGVQATINLETKVPYGPKQDFITVGQATTVTPRVNTDGTITVQFAAQDTEIAGPPHEADGPPPTTSQSFSTTRTAKSGETIILSGLAQKAPRGETERLILLTPKIIP
ncbi:MAG: type II and III secretion system protein, partial [Armatimonadota bacterium]|nr:type II and III secretion system protein [Armatimonadota bacterium]